MIVMDKEDRVHLNLEMKTCSKELIANQTWQKKTLNKLKGIAIETVPNRKEKKRTEYQ